MVSVAIRHITSEEAVTGEIATVGTDLAKNVCIVQGVDAHGKALLCKTLSRGKLIELMAWLPQCIVGMEACFGIHQLVRGKRQDPILQRVRAQSRAGTPPWQNDSPRNE